MKIVMAVTQVVIIAAIVAIMAAPLVILLGSCGCASQIGHDVGQDQGSHNVTTSQPVAADDGGVVQAGRRVVSALVSIGGGDKTYNVPPAVTYMLGAMWLIEHWTARLERRRSHKRQIERIRRGTGS